MLNSFEINYSKTKLYNAIQQKYGLKHSKPRKPNAEYKRSENWKKL